MSRRFVLRRRGARALPSALALLLPLALAAAALAAPESPVRVSGVLFDGMLRGNPEPESALRLTNTSDKPARVGGFALTDAYTPGRTPDLAVASADDRTATAARRADAERDPSLRQGRRGRTVRLPEGAEIPPHGEIWIAHQGKAFESVFGFPPHYEAVNTTPDVPDLELGTGWLLLPADHGTVALLDGFGQVVDFVAYDRHKNPHFSSSDLPSQHWKGGPVRLHQSSAYGWTHQVLARDRDEAGHLVKDTDSAADWDSGFSAKHLGEEPTHRVELPGQTHFRARRLENVRAKLVATSAPDNNYRALIDAIDSAKKEIRVSVYQLTNHRIAEALLKKQIKGVQVRLWLEGAPVGGIPDQERYLVDKLAKAGAEVHFLASEAKKKIRARYRFDHSKYTIIDRRLVIIGTENYGRTGVPPIPSYGNRGWMIHIEEPTFVKQLLEVWDADYRPGKLRDVISVDDDPNDSYGLPYRDPAFTPDDTIQRGLYRRPAKPVVVDDRVDLELVLSPDTSLNENTAIIGMIRRAKKTLYVEQNSVRRRWGRRSDKAEVTPTLPLEAVVEAARRGVKVRVLLDGTWYNVQGDDDRDNDDTARYLNELGRSEGLDLAAKVINLETTHVEKIHAKGVIVDDREVFVGSINWSENSFKGNREVGVIVGHPKVAGYYADLFRRDWAESRMYEAPVTSPTTLKAAPAAGAKTIRKAAAGEKLFVVAEHGKGADGRPLWLEVRADFAKTAFVEASATGTPVASAAEAVHLLGRQAEIVGRVAQTRVSDKVIQLRFLDDVRPPFVAVIFRSSEGRFREKGLLPTSAFQGREVRVKGTVQAYKSPEIVLSRPDQIEILR